MEAQPVNEQENSALQDTPEQLHPPPQISKIENWQYSKTNGAQRIEASAQPSLMSTIIMSGTFLLTLLLIAGFFYHHFLIDAYRQQLDSQGVSVQQLKLQIRKLQGKHTQNVTIKVEKMKQPSHQTVLATRENISQVYLDVLMVQSREDVYDERTFKFSKHIVQSKFVKGNQQAKNAVEMLKYNFRSKYMHSALMDNMREREKAQFKRLSQGFNLTHEELGFCIVAPTMNNAKNYRYEYHLQSIYNLKYDPKNLKVVIIDDASTDHTPELIQQFLEQNPPAFKVELIRHTKRVTALPGIHDAILNHCSKDDVVVFADGDDQIINPWALKVFNSVYQSKNAQVVYSDHIKYIEDKNDMIRGWSREYPERVRSGNRYRQNGLAIAHLRSFRAHLYHHIKEQDLKDANGNWFTSNYDDAIFNPILELSCGRVQYLKNEFFYLYNAGIGSGDWENLQTQMKNNIKYIRNKKKYQCLDKPKK